VEKSKKEADERTDKKGHAFILMRKNKKE